MNKTESEINMTEQRGAYNLSDKRIIAETAKASETFVSENKAYSFELEEDEVTPPGTNKNEGGANEFQF